MSREGGLGLSAVSLGRVIRLGAVGRGWGPSAGSVGRRQRVVTGRSELWPTEEAWSGVKRLVASSCGFGRPIVDSVVRRKRRSRDPGGSRGFLR